MLQERSAFLANSLWRILKYLLINLWGWQTESAHQLSVGMASWLFATGALLIPLWMFNFRPKRWRSVTIAPEEADPKLWRALTAVSMLYLLVGAFWFQHWYVLWVLASAVLLPDSRFTLSLLPWLAFGALSSNVAMDFLLNTVTKTSPSLVNYILAVAIIWGPVLLAAGIFVLAQRRGKIALTAQALRTK